MLVRGKIVGKNYSAPFVVRKDKGGVSVTVELGDEDFTYSIDCPCLEPLEFLGLLLPSLEEELGEIQGVFVEEVKEEKSHSRLKSLLRFLSKGG
ncbi:hypothetical protein E3E35_09255 [Thermococcus sp. GR7]|uniref:hypothetical protein n=1 Tax=unclassified Thermococcus TaxID=2627626 RepID=UPI00143060E5|nr:MULTISPECIES: hypothetical protein [unclassified Thermococcus]NJE47579.1 hypothetical protein [Thermococcus sp. GR7]NJE79329.1 hypothetical protein [Thermococcus sp. GR4]NJF22465.1 hypothetical protein [Thermococcus sp. GR5]